MARYVGTKQVLEEVGSSLGEAIPELTEAHAVPEISLTWVVVSVLLAAAAHALGCQPADVLTTHRQTPRA